MAKRIKLPPGVVPLNAVGAQPGDGDDVDSPIIPGQTDGPLTLLEKPDEDAEKLSEFMELFGGKEYRVRVEQYDQADKCWAHVDTFNVDGFEPYEVCKKYGPGRYRMTFLNERGRYVRGGQPQIRIGGRPLPPDAIPGAALAPVESDPLKHPLVALLLANAEQSRKESNDLIRALLTKPEPAKSSSMEVIELFKSMRSLAPEDSMKKVQETLMMRMIEKGLEGGDGGGDGGGGILSDIKDALPILREMLAARAQPPAVRTVPPAARLSLPGAQPAVVAKPATETPNPMLEALKPYVAIFKAKAENNIDQDRAAGYLIDELYDSVIPLIKKHIPVAALASDEAVIESLVGRAKNPAQVEELFAHVPDLAAHRDWVLGVIGKAVAQLEAPEEGA